LLRRVRLVRWPVRQRTICVCFPSFSSSFSDEKQQDREAAYRRRSAIEPGWDDPSASSHPVNSLGLNSRYAGIFPLFSFSLVSKKKKKKGENGGGEESCDDVLHRFRLRRAQCCLTFLITSPRKKRGKAIRERGKGRGEQPRRFAAKGTLNCCASSACHLPIWREKKGKEGGGERKEERKEGEKKKKDARGPSRG